VLKSIWLEGKRNWCMDHLIHMLVIEFLPDLEICHKQQTLGMEGLNLAEKCHQQLLMCAPKTPITKIQKINNLHFEVKSSTSNKTYQIDLDTTTCSCSNLPCICLCKHIVAIAHFFEELILDPNHLATQAQASWLCVNHQTSRTVASAVQMMAPLLLSF
jgi:hypothetical protein